MRNFSAAGSDNRGHFRRGLGAAGLAERHHGARRCPCCHVQSALECSFPQVPALVRCPVSPGVLESWFMSRRFVSQLAHQESIDQVFLASEKQLRPNRNGNLYLQVDLSDRSGSIGADVERQRAGLSRLRERRLRARRRLHAVVSGDDPVDRHQHPPGAPRRRRPRRLHDPGLERDRPVRHQAGRHAAQDRAIRTCSTWPNAFWWTRTSCGNSAGRRPA